MTTNSNRWLKQAKETPLRVRNFIDGRYQPGDSSVSDITKHSPRDASLLYQFGAGDEADVMQAVDSARQAFDDGHWRTASMYNRQSVLHNLADLVASHREELALYECLDVGKPIAKALGEDIPLAIDYLRSNADMANKLLGPSGAHGSNFSFQLRKPIGVVGGIVGWNFPLTLAASKVGPALAMGNSLVLKPSEFSSLSASRLAELALEAGVPAGVFNVVHGAGAIVGSALAKHRDVNLLTFTGSSATGKHIMMASAQSNMKRLVLECGGKSPYIVFDDCPDDLDFIAADIVARAFANQGAVCVASTRVLIQECLKERLLTKILEQTEKLKPRDPLDPDTTFGAIINEAHMNKVLAYIDSGQQEGAKLLYGGHRVDVNTGDGGEGGYYIEPTIFTDVDPQQKIAREEIFGPVLSVFTFKDEAEAIRLANDSCYGLAAYVATLSLGRCHRMAQSLETSSVTIIGSSSPRPSGVDIGIEPHKESGLGTEGGLDGLAAYTASSVVHVKA